MVYSIDNMKITCTVHKKISIDENLTFWNGIEMQKRDF